MNRSSVNEVAFDLVAAVMRRPLLEYARLVEKLAAENLAGLTVWGAVLDPAYDEAQKPAQSAVVLRRMDLPMLRHLGEHGPALARQRIAPPVVMTPDYIRASLDSFPLELIEIGSGTPRRRA